MKLNRKEQLLCLDGKFYTPDECIRMAGEETLSMQSELFQFLADWFADSPYITVQTSGSTGTPKQLTVRKEQMMQSARLTCEFLGLKQGHTALLCMPLQYIAGKMVVVRALVAGLNLLVRTPSGRPLVDVHTPLDFAAMVPLQVYNSLRTPVERERLKQVVRLIIGGGFIDASLEKELRTFPESIYCTYGMTETLSHVALRRLNGPDASAAYQPFPSVRLSLSPEDTLIIDAPLVCDELLVTNDVARIHPDGSFTILGRKDNVINTGGIKVQIEEVESILCPHISLPFAITSVPDVRLGEVVVLLLEYTGPSAVAIIEDVKTWVSMPNALPPFHCPKHILTVPSLPLTGSGKTDRSGCKTLAAQLLTIL